MKSLEQMTKSEIERLEDRQSAACSDNTRALIDAGFGEMRFSEIEAAAKEPGANPLFIEHARVNAAWFATRGELERRECWHGTHHRIIRRD